MPPARNSLPTIYIVGAGGIGCSLAATIHHAGHPVKLVEKCPQKVSWGLANGVKVSGFPAQNIPIVPFETWAPGPDDLVFLCVKCFANEEVLAKVPQLTTIIPVQNGYEKQLTARKHTFEGIASYIAESEPGKTMTKITRPGSLHLGFAVPNEKPGLDLESFAPLIRIPGVQLQIISDINPIKSTKFIYNCAISPLASGCGVDNGQLLGNPRIRRLFLGLLKENLGILNARKIPLGKVGPFAPTTVVNILNNSWVSSLLARWFKGSLDKTYCSMAGDWATGRTELDNYLGHLLDLAEDFPCPLNRALYKWCKERLERKLPASMELISHLENSFVGGA